jgi:hypothetical protein
VKIRRYIKLFALVLVAILAAGLVPASAAPTTAPAAAPEDAALTISRGALTQRPYVVMIDNHPAAYPQTGLDHAAIVFEALAEFGITRFMAVYTPGITPDAPTIGPVRSARPYFVEWASGFRGLFAHAGGSPEALRMAATSDVIVDLDALGRGTGAIFWRSRSRAAPHNLFTNGEALGSVAAARGAVELSDGEIGFLIKPDQPLEGRGPGPEVRYFFLSRQDTAGWVYNQEANAYYRMRRGKAAIDAATGAQLRAKNVVIIEVREQEIAGDAKGRIEQQVIGEGVGRLLQDGMIAEITWRKESAAAPLRFFLADGAEAWMNAGPTWIVALPSINNLTVR